MKNKHKKTRPAKKKTTSNETALRRLLQKRLEHARVDIQRLQEVTKAQRNEVVRLRKLVSKVIDDNAIAGVDIVAARLRSAESHLEMIHRFAAKADRMEANIERLMSWYFSRHKDQATANREADAGRLQALRQAVSAE